MTRVGVITSSLTSCCAAVAVLPARPRGSLPMIALRVGIVALLAAPVLAAATNTLTYEDLLAHMTDLDRLPVIEPGEYFLFVDSQDRGGPYAITLPPD